MTSWVLAPAILALICCGLSLLVERAVKVRLPWTLRPALGMAVLIVLAQLGTMSEVTAGYTLAGAALLGVAGLALGFATRRPEDQRGDVQDGWGLAAGALAFALYGLPFFVRGEATWAGYIKLDDTATFMAMADWAFEHGRGIPETALGSFAVTIQDNLGVGYPIGSFVGAALMGWLPGQDIAWTIQPGMAFGAACLAMALFEIARRLVRWAELAAAVSLIATLSALLLGYYLWGGVKELAAAALIALGPAIVMAARDGRGGGEGESRLVCAIPGQEPRLGILFGIVAGALAGALGLGGGIWIAPILLLLVTGVWRLQGRAQALRLGVVAAASGALLSLPSIFTPAGFFNPLQSGLTAETELGNLAESLNILQLAGLWPALDFRQDPSSSLLVTALILVVFAAAAWILWRSWWRPLIPGLTGSPFAALLAGGLIATLVTVLIGSPWVGAKALATFSPFVLFAGLAGLVLAGQEARRPAVSGLMAVLALSVAAVAVWGAINAYQGISFAPRAHYEELADIDSRFAGQGPALSTEVSVSGPRHFLRHLDANSASGRRAYEVLTRQGEPHPAGTHLDLSEIRPDQLRQFPLLVTRRSPLDSRPPSEFELVWEGRYYEVWRQLPPDGTALVQDLSLGGAHDPGAVALCEQVRTVAEMVGPDGEMRAAPVIAAPWVMRMSDAALEPGWQILGEDTFSPLSEGALEVEADLPEAGRYTLWIGGEVYGGLGAEVDGEQVGELRGAVNNGGGYEQVGEVDLEAGKHRLRLTYTGGDLYPGSAFQGTWAPFPIGPVVLALDGEGGSAAPLTTVRAADHRELCGRRWDWIEARTGG